MLKAPLGLYMHLVLDKRTESPMGSQDASTNRAAGSAGARACVRREVLLATLGVIQGRIDITEVTIYWDKK
jgi:hypothetical protein